ncbi:MAG: ABC transporter permease [Clostridium sp.]
MQSFLVYLKATLKSLIKSTPINLVFFIGLPVFLTMVMGFVNDSSENPIEIEARNVIIEDNDNTQSSSDLKSFLSSTNLSSLITITDNKEEAYASIIIPEGFEKSLINNTNSNIEVVELKDKYLLVMTLEEVLKNYLNSYYSGDLTSILSTQSITTEYIEPVVAENSYAFYSSSMIGYLIAMLIMTLAGGGYNSEELGLSKRIYASPKSNLQIFLESFIVSLIQSFVLLMGYLLFFKISGISFSGSFPLLLLIAVVCCFTVTSISTVITAFCKKKYGMIIVNSLFFLHIAVGNVFIDFGDNLSKLSPLSSSQSMFHNYVYNGSLESIKSSLLITLGMGIVLFVLSLVKECRYRREI